MREHLQQELASSSAGTRRAGSPSLNKTALRALRIDALRGALREAGADEAGSKDTLVQRLLAVLQNEAQAATKEDNTVPGVGGLPSG